MTTPVRDEPPAAPEELVLGPQPSRQLPRWVPLVALLLGIVIMTGAVLWRFWPRPTAPMSLVELQDTYAGMVRSDGTNEASVMTRGVIDEDPMVFSPAQCSPLMEMVIANRFPRAAIDGVGTFWLLSPSSSVSLFTLRFAEVDAADGERRRIEGALTACSHRQMAGHPPGDPTGRRWTSFVQQEPTQDRRDVGYLLRGTDGSRLTVQLMPYLNTLTWQYRYETNSTTSSPQAADQLMRSMRSQLDAVVAARPR